MARFDPKRWARSPVVVSAALGTSLWGCSLTVDDFDACVDDAECQSVYGTLSSCGADGLCADVAPLARCERTYPDGLLDPASGGDPAVIFGAVFEDATPSGTELARSAELALRIVNEEGGIAGRQLGLVHCTPTVDAARFPERSTPEVMEAIAGYLGDVLSVAGVVGADSSLSTRALYEQIRTREVVLVSPTSTDPGFAGLDEQQPSDQRPGLLWRTAPSTLAQGLAMAATLRARTPAVERAVVIHQTDEYGTQISSLFSEEFRRLGGRPTDYGYAPGDTAALRSAIQLAVSGAFDEFVLVANQSLLEALSELSDTPQLDGIPVMLAAGDAADDVATLAFEGREALFARLRGVRVQSLDVAAPNYGSFIESFEQAFGERPGHRFAPNAFDAAWMLAAGAAWSLAAEGSAAGRSVARGLRNLQSGPAAQLRTGSWAATMSELLGQGLTVDVVGASGPLDYDLSNEELPVTFELWRLESVGGGYEIRVEGTYP